MGISTKFLREIDAKIGLIRLNKEGVINVGVAKMLAVRDKVDSLVASGMSHGKAVSHVAKEMGMTRQYTYRLLERP